MSDEPRHQCIGKRRYESKSAAKRAIKQLKKKRAGYRRAYECRLCEGWHLTSQELRGD